MAHALALNAVCGAPFRGGDVVLTTTRTHTMNHANAAGNSSALLLHASGARLLASDLSAGAERLFSPREARAALVRVCASNDGNAVLAVDADGLALLMTPDHAKHGAAGNLGGAVHAACFSPRRNDEFATCVGRLVKVWRVFQRERFYLRMTFGQCTARATHVSYSPDGKYLVVCSEDLAVRVLKLVADNEPAAKARRRAEGDDSEGNDEDGNDADADGESKIEPVILHGHRATPVGAWFGRQGGIYSIGQDGVVIGWRPMEVPTAKEMQAHKKKRRLPLWAGADGLAYGAAWKYFAGLPGPGGRDVTAAAFANAEAPLLVVGLRNGAFRVFQMPLFYNGAADAVAKQGAIEGQSAMPVELHTLSAAPGAPLDSICFGGPSAAAADDGKANYPWIAIGCKTLGQVVVWDWRRETYVMRQRGHSYQVNRCAVSPSGETFATASDDGTVKLWHANSCHAIATYSGHAAPVADVCFMQAGGVVASASRDGTVRLHDVTRHRCFRVLTSPEAAPLTCLRGDAAGDVIAAGSGGGSFLIYVWAVRTGKLLDSLSGHTAPIVGVRFAPHGHPYLASTSWDKSLRLWDVFGTAVNESFAHLHDATALDYKPDGKEIAVATLDGAVTFWDPEAGQARGTIDGKRHVGMRRTAADGQGLPEGGHFQCVAYSANGETLYAAGLGPYLCIYDSVRRVLLRRVEMTAAKRLWNAIADRVDTRNITEAGARSMLDVAPSDALGALGARPGRGGSAAPSASIAPRHSAAAVGGSPEAVLDLPGMRAGGSLVYSIRDVQPSSDGTRLVAASTEGVLVLAKDTGVAFDPVDLGGAGAWATPAAVARRAAEGEFLTGLVAALRLGETALAERVMLAVPAAEVESVVRDVPDALVVPLLEVLAACVGKASGNASGKDGDSRPPLERTLTWVRALVAAKAPAISARGGACAPPLRAVLGELAAVQRDIGEACVRNRDLLRFCCSTALDL